MSGHKDEQSCPASEDHGKIPLGEMRRKLVDRLPQVMPKGEPVPPEDQPGFMSNFDTEPDDENDGIV